MLYQMSKKKLDKSVFADPPANYRGIPFWSWNCRITKEMIDEQLPYFKEMGMGGVHIHVRVGLKNQYMGEEFLELVSYCNEKAKELGMQCWLYDEDRYASGYAGGEVTKIVAFRARHLRLTRTRKEEMVNDYEIFREMQAANEKVVGCLMAVYDIVLQDGYLQSCKMIDAEAEAMGKKWFLYMELEKETPWCNNQTYVDVMNEEAIQSFIQHTHEKYASVLQQEFGKNIPAIFTDEPNLSGLQMPDRADTDKDVRLPFTEKLPQRFAEISEEDFFEAFPYIVWNRKEKEYQKERYFYFETCSQMFSQIYCGQIREWCEKQNLLSTGHILSEETLEGQMANAGDAMRCYSEFHLPGIDNLCDYREFSAVKQASSVAHQCGKEGVLSECYGVTQWDFDFRGYKLAGDWQAALGINLRVPHLAWASMAGEAKRDYPAVIGWQSPWYKEYQLIEDYFSRINYCLTRGEPEIHIAVLHPMESMWVLQGPADQMGMERKQLEEDFKNITEWLLTNGLDFDYVSEAILEQEVGENAETGFVCGAMTYDVVLVPNCFILRKNTIKRLLKFQKMGGHILFYGHQENVQSDSNRFCSVGEIFGKERWISGKLRLLEALEPWRQIDICGIDGNRRDIYLHQIRREGENKWLFLAQAYTGKKSRERDLWNRRKLHDAEKIAISICGRWQVEKYDALSGETTLLESKIEGARTVLTYEMYGDDSLLLHLTPKPEHMVSGNVRIQEQKCAAKKKKIIDKAGQPYAYRLSEPNALLLDTCDCSLDEKAWRMNEEILKADNGIRRQLGYPLRMESVEQPYVRKESKRDHSVRLKMTFLSEVEMCGCSLALEEREYSRIFLNGEPVEMQAAGYYVDASIETVRLPCIRKGENELIVEMQYGRDTNLEWMYILGDFGVKLQGNEKVLISRPEKLYWGDYARQGFPFYTGNMTYQIYISLEKEQDIRLRIPQFSGAAIRIEYGEQKKTVAFLPFECTLTGLQKGENEISVTCLGNRYNGFGQLHLIGDDLTWVGPDSWRTENESWTDAYRIKEMGVLSSPLIYET